MTVADFLSSAVVILPPSALYLHYSIHYPTFRLDMYAFSQVLFLVYERCFFSSAGRVSDDATFASLCSFFRRFFSAAFLWRYSNLLFILSSIAPTLFGLLDCDDDDEGSLADIVVDEESVECIDSLIMISLFVVEICKVLILSNLWKTILTTQCID